MTFTYDQSVRSHHLLLRCFPQDTARQHVEQLECEVEPKIDLVFDDDHFGNRAASGLITHPHSRLRAVVRGKVRTGLDIFEDTQSDALKAGVYRYPSTYTKPGEALNAYRQELQLDREEGAYNKVLRIMRALAQDMRYEKNVTDIHTTADDAIAQGHGVCQDYAHIMLALCRMERIPSRYTVGLMMGEGMTHAWVEALCKGYWYGFDPTNNLLVNDSYIKFSHGRDYEDCAVNKGFFTGAATQRQNIEAAVSEQ